VAVRPQLWASQIALGLAVTFCAGAGPVALAYDFDPSWTPVLTTAQTYPRSTPDGTGFEDLIIKEAFRRVGLTPKIAHLPSERALVNANEGIDDGNFARIAGLDKLYPNLVIVPENICKFDFVVFTRDPSIRVVDWDDLKLYNVGIITGWKILEERVKQVRSLTRVKDTKALFQMLVSGRVDLIISDNLQGRYLIESQQLAGITALEPFLATENMYLYLNRRHAALAPLLAKALREMKRDGSFQALMNSSGAKGSHK
jgi:polar amino acid transport system substrate-binding protein